jgi:hypothetical protein
MNANVDFSTLMPYMPVVYKSSCCCVQVTCDMVRRAEAQVNMLAARLQVPPPDKVAAAAGAAAAAAAGMHGPAETVNSPFYHMGSGSNLRAMAEAAAAAAAAGATRAEPPAAPPAGGQGSGAGSGAGSGTVAAAAAGAAPAQAPAGQGVAAAAASPPLPAPTAAGGAFVGGTAASAPGTSAGHKRGAEEAGVGQGSDMMRRTRAALNVWQHLQVRASGPGMARVQGPHWMVSMLIFFHRGGKLNSGPHGG